MVIDADDPGLVQWAIERFGETEVMVRTPSGGVHLYYRYSGEESRDLRQAEGRAVEIKSDETQVLLPPSVGANGNSYRWEGDFGPEGFERLRPLKGHQTPKPASCVETLRVGQGQRNDHLFRRGLRLARYCSGGTALEGQLLAENSECDPPLPETEVIRIARSAWGYQVAGINWAGSNGVEPLSFEDLFSFGGKADAYMLWSYLRHFHAARDRRGEAFAISPKAMAEADVISGWGKKRYRSARNSLLALQKIQCVHKGGQGPKDPDQYRFCSKGAARDYNATNTPPGVKKVEVG